MKVHREAFGMQTKRAAAAALAGLFALTAAGPTLAQTKGEVTPAAKAAARRDYKAAEAKFADASYAAALKLYEAAEATVPIPQTKYKIAVCKDKLGQVTEAVRWYQLFLDSVPPEKADKLAVDMADARTRLATLERTPGQVRIVATPPTARVLVSVDGAPPQPAGASVALPPGHHRLAFTADGFEAITTEIDLSPADGKEVRLPFAPARPSAVAAAPAPPSGPPLPSAATAAPSPPLPATAPPPPRRSNVPAFVLLGVAGSGLVVGTSFGFIALQDKNKFNKTPSSSQADTTHTHAMIADIAFGAAAAVGITGIVLLATNTGPSRGEATARAFVTPYAGPSSAGAVAGLTF
jgi:hypothetical protein